MADQYPWGTQTPKARIAKLQGTLEASARSRATAVKKHKEHLAKFDKADRQTKSDIRQCQQVLDKERTEAQAAHFMKIAMKALGNADASALDEALSSGQIEKRLQSLVSDIEAENTGSDGKPDSSAEVSDPKA